jgi:hypothetical protein
VLLVTSIVRFTHLLYNRSVECQFSTSTVCVLDKGFKYTRVNIMLRQNTFPSGTSNPKFLSASSHRKPEVGKQRLPFDCTPRNRMLHARTAGHPDSPGLSKISLSSCGSSCCVLLTSIPEITLIIVDSTYVVYLTSSLKS